MRKVLALTWMILSAVPGSAVAQCTNRAYGAEHEDAREILEEQHSQCEQLEQLQRDINDVKRTLESVRDILTYQGGSK
jgi:uncharacterized protein YlxW (UPF0749 family)